MRNEEKLYLAIGEIDERLIEDAGAAYKKPFPIKKFVAAAACVAIVTVAAIGMSNMLDLMDKGGNLGGGMAPEMNGSAAPEFGGDDSPSEGEVPENDVLISDIGILTLIESDGKSFRFHLNITLPTYLPIDVYLYSKDGKAVYTTADSINDTESLTSIYRPIILVDGEEAERLPGEIGEYVVTISFEGIAELDYDWRSYFTINNFGPFTHGMELD